jgi:hypothetical protein
VWDVVDSGTCHFMNAPVLSIDMSELTDAFDFIMPKKIKTIFVVRY